MKLGNNDEYGICNYCKSPSQFPSMESRTLTETNMSVMKILSVVVSSALLIYVAICVFMLFFQKHLIHIPYEQLVGDPLSKGMEFEDLYLTTPDNAQLHAWYIPNSNSDYTFWIFSGNAGNKSYMLDAVQLIYDLGYSVFIYDYRGYGPSKGKLTEQTQYEDAEFLWKYLTQTRNIPPNQIVLHGRSLGTAMASWVATNAEPAALILESGFTSVTDMSKHIYGWLPIDLILRWKYDNLERITQYSGPTLLIHSTDDEIVPYQHSVRLFEAAPGTKQILELSGTHLEGYMDNKEIYTDGIARFIALVNS